MYHKSDPVEMSAMQQHVKNMIARALEMDGTSTVSLQSCWAILVAKMRQDEHSISYFKKAEPLHNLGTDTMEVMKSIEQALDPHWLLNPGKIFDTLS